jgi:flagellum-specific peptidoglycan hydrolase FlgJ
MVTAAEKKAFIADASKAAQTSEQKTGVPASVTIAQAILESGWGKSHMGDANNYFGIKAQVVKGKVPFGTVAVGFVDKETKEVDKNGQTITITAHFRKYKSMADSFVDHGLFLSDNARYRPALKAYSTSKDANAFAQGLQDAGYATDPNYAKLLVTLMKGNDLYQFNAK